jgi:aryl-alcohol dehydrogenase-like predicted oxidoreductase
MRTRELGTSGMHITPIGFGAWAIGGPGWAFAWGGQDDDDSLAAIRASLDAGINWIDTAAVYGLGHSEEVVARALEGMRERPYVFTKCGMVWDDRRDVGFRLKAASLRRECEASLRRLRVDALDLYQIHWPKPAQDVEEGWATLARLREEGKVRHIGVSNFDVGQLRSVQKIAPVTSLQSPYSLLDRAVEPDVLPHVGQGIIGFLAYSPMASGLLSGAMTYERVANLPPDDWRRGHPNFQEPHLSFNLRLASLLRVIGHEHDVTAGAVAIAWVLHHPAVTAAIVGTRRHAQVADVVRAADLPLDRVDLAAIDCFFAAEADRTNEVVASAS